VHSLQLAMDCLQEVQVSPVAEANFPVSQVVQKEALVHSMQLAIRLLHAVQDVATKTYPAWQPWQVGGDRPSWQVVQEVASEQVAQTARQA
jgi:hypothetical protein